MSCEVTVTVKDEEKTLKTKHLIYETLTADENDPVLKKLVDETIKNFGSEPSDISIRINLEVR